MKTKTSGLYASQFERQPQDFYKTPGWVTQCLIDTVPLRGFVWEPCAGDGALAAVLADAGYKVAASDLMWRDGGPHPVIGGVDALAAPLPPGVQTIATNPPYGLLPQLIPHWLAQLEPVDGMLCLLLRAPYGESGKGQDLSTRHSTYAGRVRLPRRIQWFEGSASSSKEDHCWCCWDWSRDRTKMPFDISAGDRRLFSGCAVCGQSLEHLRTGAKTCSARCRAALSRRLSSKVSPTAAGSV